MRQTSNLSVNAEGQLVIRVRKGNKQIKVDSISSTPWGEIVFVNLKTGIVLQS